MDLQPSLYRVAVTALILATAGNVLLWRVSRVDDWFANIIAVASGVAAAVLIASALIPAMARWREEALLLTFAMWSANFLEFVTETNASWESRARNCSFYASYAVLALGCFLVVRLQRDEGKAV